MSVTVNWLCVKEYQSLRIEGISVGSVERGGSEKKVDGGRKRRRQMGLSIYYVRTGNEEARH
jgi:hypothetical protein